MREAPPIAGQALPLSGRASRTNAGHGYNKEGGGSPARVFDVLGKPASIQSYFWPEGEGVPTRSELQIVNQNSNRVARKRVEEIVEVMDIGKRDPRSACERGGGGAVNIIGWGGMIRDQSLTGVFSCFARMVGGASKTKICFPFPLSARRAPRSGARATVALR